MNSKSELLSFKYELYLILLPLFFVLHGFNNNESVILIKDVLLLLLKYLIFFLLILLVVSKGLKSPKKASVFTGFLMFIFFFFGLAHDLLKLYLQNTLITRYSILLPIIIILITIVYKVIKKTNHSFQRILVYLNVLLTIFIVLELSYLLKSNLLQNKNGVVKNSQIPKGNKNPDVYFIIADGYAGQNALINILNFDNSEFLNQLKLKGFHIVPHSKSNYNLTPYSLASTFKMNYLDLNSFKENPKDLNYCFKNINSNPVIDFFKQLNYKIYNFSIFRFDNLPPLENSQFFEVGPGIINSQTLLGRIERDIAFNLLTKYKFKWAMRLAVEKEVQKTEHLYQKTLELASKSSNVPRFVYTHLMMPHYPYYLDSTGNFNYYNSITEENWSSKQNYLGYLKYCNNKLIKMVDHILLNSDKPPIILLMGDHGFREFSSKEEFRKYYFMNLNAIFLPNKNYSSFKEDISNVNEFRCLLNAGFNQNSKLVSDSTFFIN
jgi:hypothetical protein